ncbi:hypothetical protein ABW21_db0204634 [Orbilia brochopaga]|nr:hypothetical protein ABW21_db0204634 [Drechslerella brochopaga]
MLCMKASNIFLFVSLLLTAHVGGLPVPALPDQAVETIDTEAPHEKLLRKLEPKWVHYDGQVALFGNCDLASEDTCDICCLKSGHSGGLWNGVCRCWGDKTQI